MNFLALFGPIPPSPLPNDFRPAHAGLFFVWYPIKSASLRSLLVQEMKDRRLEWTMR
jgi:hypothetical protein